MPENNDSICSMINKVKYRDQGWKNLLESGDARSSAVYNDDIRCILLLLLEENENLGKVVEILSDEIDKINQRLENERY
jgi:hypothetical protein